MALSKLVAFAGLCHGITLDHDEFSINLLPSQVNVQTVELVDETPNDVLELIKKDSEEKPFLKYYYSSQKFVPTQELNVVYLNGMKFFQQGEEVQPETKSWWQADTRSANKVQCEGRLDQKLYQMEHRVAKGRQSSTTMANDFVTFDDLDAADTSGGIRGGRRRGGPTPKRKAARAQNLQIPQNSFDFARTGGDLVSNSGIDLAALFADTTDFTIDDIPTTTTSNPTTTQATDVTTDAVVIETRYPKIGCCNGVPYNSSKRCCCRRVAFNKDDKFCCAINGCQKFKVFDKADPKNYDLCRGLSGLVVQEYGYRGLHESDGEPNLAKRERAPSV